MPCLLVAMSKPARSNWRNLWDDPPRTNQRVLVKFGKHILVTTPIVRMGKFKVTCHYGNSVKWCPIPK